jgi:hypothetical protein
MMYCQNPAARVLRWHALHRYGCMIGPTTTLEFTDGRSLKGILDAGNDEMALVHGRGLLELLSGSCRH